MNIAYKVLGLVGKVVPLVWAILGLCLVIVVHEFGHFVFAKMFGIHTPTFSVGFGPKIVERKFGDTNFRLSAIPLGGYVEIAGLAEHGQGEQNHASERGKMSFADKPYWQKFLVILGGITFNMLFAYLAFIALLFFGTPKHHVAIKEVVAGSAAQEAGLAPGDAIYSIGQYDIIEHPEELEKALTDIKEKQGVVHFRIMRDGKELMVPITVPGATPEGQGRLGIALEMVPTGEKERLPLLEAIPEGIRRVHQVTYQTASFLGKLIRERTLEGAGGPVMIISESARQAKQGFIYLLFLLAVISINLAIINLLPIPALDGGQFVFITIEAIIGREVPVVIKNVVFLASWVFLLTLILLFTFNDIKRLLGY